MADQKELTPAAELVKKASRPYPNESDDYRRARAALLAEEIELRRQIQRVAEQRRALPPGAEAKDYRFSTSRATSSASPTCSAARHALHLFLDVGPERERPCPMCTSFVGSLDIPAPDIEQRLAIAISAARRSRGSSPSRASAAGATSNSTRRSAMNSPRDYRGLAATARRGRRSRLGQARRRRSTPVLGAPRAAGDRRSRLRSASRARSDAAVEHPRLDARRTRHRLVSEARLRRQECLIAARRCGLRVDPRAIAEVRVPPRMAALPVSGVNYSADVILSTLRAQRRRARSGDAASAQTFARSVRAFISGSFLDLLALSIASSAYCRN